MSVAPKLGIMVVLLAMGLLGRRANVLTGPRTKRLTQVAFYVALPALIFSSTADRALGEVVSWRLVLGVVVVLILGASVGIAVHRRNPDPGRRAVAVVQSYHCNMGFLGAPMVAAFYGDLATAKASIILGTGALVQIPLTVVLLARITGSEVSLRRELRRLVRNPILLSLAAGLLASSVRLEIPPTATRVLTALGDSALPIALIAVGATLSLRESSLDASTIGGIVGVKLFVLPIVAVSTFSLLEATPSTVRAAVLMLSMPTAVSTYVYASEIGGDSELASTGIVATTALSVGSLFVVTRVLSILVGG